MTATEIARQDSRGRIFANFYPRRDPASGPGWYVFGRNPEYAGALIMLCARPDVKPRKHPHYNCLVRRGYHTKAEAAHVAAQLNRR